MSTGRIVIETSTVLLRSIASLPTNTPWRIPMYEIQVLDYDYGWKTRTTSRDVLPLLATYHLLCEDWRDGKEKDIVNIRLVLVMLQDHPG